MFNNTEGKKRTFFIFQILTYFYPFHSHTKEWVTWFCIQFGLSLLLWSGGYPITFNFLSNLQPSGIDHRMQLHHKTSQKYFFFFTTHTKRYISSFAHDLWKLHGATLHIYNRSQVCNNIFFHITHIYYLARNILKRTNKNKKKNLSTSLDAV